MDELAESLLVAARVRRLCVTATYERRLRNIGALFDTTQQARLAAMLAAVKPDVVHVNQQVAEDGLDFVRAAERSGIPWISTIHIGRTARDLGALGGRLRDMVTTQALRRSGSVHVAVSEASRAQITSRFLNGSKKPRVVVVHNGVPVPEASVLVAARETARDDWGIEQDEIVVGAVGRIEAQKNPLALVHHLQALAENGHSVRLVWIGDGQLREKLESEATARLGSNRLVVDGWRRDAATRMAGFDIFAMPSIYEGLPLALLEAMHVGLPIVATRTDGTPEAIEHDVSGLLCTGREEFLQSLKLLAGDTERRKVLGNAAREVARQRFSCSVMAERLIEIYKEQVSARRHRPS
jgi:glycosyltransferase involved in cell wall biosynthesis